jgi:amino acid adenylation domain-containing protein
MSGSGGWRSVVELFEGRVAGSPDSVALVDVDGRAVSYVELNRAANRLARYLVDRGVRPDVRVALVLERSAALVVALLAVLKAGGTYVPIDPDYPDPRVSFMFADAEPMLALTTSDLVDRLPAGARPVLLDDEAERDSPDGNLVSRLEPEHTAYVIYTSGSTGTPKGVVVSHGNLDRLFTATEPTFGFGPDDVWTLFHSYSFDFSVWELWGALLHGGRIVLVSREVSRSPQAFLRLLVEQRVTVLNQTPSAFYQLMNADRDARELGAALALRYVILGGEAVEPALFTGWYDRHPDDFPVVVNGYGITETTVFATFRFMDRDFAGSAGGSFIGDAISDLPVYVLDESLRPAGTGVGGELHIGGAGVAAGYLGRPSLTAQRFVPDPFGQPGARMYRSGDLARRTAEGELEYLGRADDQIKLRGFRIELGEIEVVVSACPGVAQAAVVVREDQPGDKRIVAYVVADRAAGSPDEVAAAVRRSVQSRLPHYMIPSSVLPIAAVPLTTNGKLDKAALPAPGPAAAAERRPPCTGTERAVAAIWAELLGARQVWLDDHYLELGGQSLTAAAVTARIRAELRVNVQVRDLYDNPVLVDFAARVDELDATGRSAPPPIRRLDHAGTGQPASLATAGRTLEGGRR